MIYFDSCYLVKLYLMEPDSARVRARAEASDGLACCATGRGEVVATFHRHFREKRLMRREFRQLAAQVEVDLEAGLWTALPVTSSLIEAQARRMAALPAEVFLRAADALHLACAADAGLREIYSSDRHLAAAAPYFGLRPVRL
jgi:predicted nucleic acid-binding protein